MSERIGALCWLCPGIGSIGREVDQVAVCGDSSMHVYETWHHRTRIMPSA